MKSVYLLILFYLFCYISMYGQKVHDNQSLLCNSSNVTELMLSDTEKTQGWELLFDGYTLNGWHVLGKSTPPDSGWIIKNGVLEVFVDSIGIDIISDTKYENFELVFQFKITKGANSGIKYYVTENGYGKGALGLEYQILDDDNHLDAKLGVNGNHTLGSLYDLKTAVNKHVNVIGQWNSGRIIAVNNHIEHWLNGIKILEYERGSDLYYEWVAKSKFKNCNAFGMAKEGHILIQDHSNCVFFKNIKIRKL